MSKVKSSKRKSDETKEELNSSENLYVTSSRNFLNPKNQNTKKIPKFEKVQKEEVTESIANFEEISTEFLNKNFDDDEDSMSDVENATKNEHQAHQAHQTIKKPKVSSTAGLPHWLANPYMISPHLENSSTSSISNPQWTLSPHIQNRLLSLKITHLFPVQQSVIPRLLDATSTNDLCVAAPTGSGKTLAYAIPIIETLTSRVIPRIRALVVLPTRDLALQVKATFDSLVKGTGLKVVVMIGGTHSKFSSESTVVSGGNVDIVVATAGRLVDHLDHTHEFSLNALQFLVIDEADRLLNQKYQDWLARVLKATELKGETGLFEHVPLKKLLFSATLTRNPAKITMLKLNSPVYIAVSTSSTYKPEESKEDDNENDDKIADRYVAPPSLSEHLVVCASESDKPLALLYLLETQDIASAGGVLIFTRSVENAHRLATLLHILGRTTTTDKKGHIASTRAVSSELPATMRKSILKEFSNNSIACLVCSDVMARGIDLGHDGVKTVINYDAPLRVKTYVHRVGRTARAGLLGRAYTIAERKEARWVKQEVLAKVSRVEKFSKMELEVKTMDPFVDRLKDALKELELVVKGKSGLDDELKSAKQAEIMKFNEKANKKLDSEVNEDSENGVDDKESEGEDEENIFNIAKEKKVFGDSTTEKSQVKMDEKKMKFFALALSKLGAVAGESIQFLPKVTNKPNQLWW
ncbi:ATP-dependent RNA helicase dbp6 [Nowakowskiella sp. JEL0078]|nr:ATP-dependent RNA helicase dbp6 [Nowakowskiella sp. JEL0078]